ncbi:taurine catabolism dioxygenase TauD [Sorangium cellulosum]|uniref:Taurine catabolism dioxygenase TauD n=1 Tax=Sorangium cellulosum TaxID=56 RepID=A0A150PCU8_SORCE|nr:taurine catabolism dioxygenase TauD [Sorangium cellulosum]
MSRVTKNTSHRHGDGALITAQPGTSLDVLDRSIVMLTLADAGFLVLRGFDGGLGEFSRLVRRMSERITLDPARSLHGGVAQKVDAGLDAIGLHCENGNSPFMPHLCWFFCEKAASIGSETTVCDGYRVWDALSPAARRAFLERDIVYSRHVEAAKWKSFVYHSLQGQKRIEDITPGDLLSLADARRGTVIRPSGGDAIYYEFQVPAASGTLFSDRIAFANSILGPSCNYERPTITFADREPIPPWLIDEVVRVTESVTVDIAWRDGDVALIDNTRVMHGRRAIVDPRRTIYNALSFIRRREAPAGEG